MKRSDLEVSLLQTGGEPFGNLGLQQPKRTTYYISRYGVRRWISAQTSMAAKNRTSVCTGV